MATFDKSEGAIAFLDVGYCEQTANGACVMANAWTDPSPVHCHVIRCPIESAYVPGEFYKRELPVVLRLLSELPGSIRTVVVDGHAWLEPDRPGLGARLYLELQERIPVIGVAKSSFKESACAVQVLRGSSNRPLFITACGMNADSAVEWIKSMHGDYRIPTLLQKADQLSRSIN